MIHSWRQLDRVLRFSSGSSTMARSIGLKSKKWNKPDWHHPFCTTNCALGIHFTITKGMDRAECRGVTKKAIACHTKDDVWPASILENTSHRDGSIYHKDHEFLRVYRITDRAETRLEPMALSEPTNCWPNREKCMEHLSKPMVQILSLNLAKIPTDRDSIQLYGYIAVRDDQDSLLNYIVNRSRDEAILMQQGSLIEMTGPKRGISMLGLMLVEFDMRIKNGDREEDDLQLIDGMIDYDICMPYCPFKNRINGDCGAVDITLAHILSGVEATIEVVISKVQNGFHLSLSSFVSTNELYEEQEIRLFHGIIGESCGLRRYVVAVKMDTWMHLIFKVGQNDFKNDVERYISFEANTHGCVGGQVMLEFASISVKVTWSTLPI